LLERSLLGFSWLLVRLLVVLLLSVMGVVLLRPELLEKPVLYVLQLSGLLLLRRLLVMLLRRLDVARLVSRFLTGLEMATGVLLVAHLVSPRFPLSAHVSLLEVCRLLLLSEVPFEETLVSVLPLLLLSIRFLAGLIRLVLAVRFCTMQPTSVLPWMVLCAFLDLTYVRLLSESWIAIVFVTHSSVVVAVSLSAWLRFGGGTTDPSSIITVFHGLCKHVLMREYRLESRIGGETSYRALGVSMSTLVTVVEHTPSSGVGCIRSCQSCLPGFERTRPNEGFSLQTSRLFDPSRENEHEQGHEQRSRE
jgi:hypothetical protein